MALSGRYYDDFTTVARLHHVLMGLPVRLAFLWGSQCVNGVLNTTMAWFTKLALRSSGDHDFHVQPAIKTGVSSLYSRRENVVETP